MIISRRNAEERFQCNMGSVPAPNDTRPSTLMGISAPNMRPRPEDLPDFLKPPLNEVVLGVQFNEPTGYQLIRAFEVWSLFREVYPEVHEQPPLAPIFETFGLPTQAISPIQFFPAPPPPRFWFMRPDGVELIQFQPDRLLHNWRKVGDGTNEYPRFESMVVGFRAELEKLQAYFAGFGQPSLNINQCEVSYINHILKIPGTSSAPSDWLNMIHFGEQDPEVFSLSFRNIIRDEIGKPLGRFMCDVGSASLRNDGQQIITLTLTVRGPPRAPTLASAVEFLMTGRDLIVRRFAELTTTAAHKVWERIK